MKYVSVAFGIAALELLSPNGFAQSISSDTPIESSSAPSAAPTASSAPTASTAPVASPAPAAETARPEPPAIASTAFGTAGPSTPYSQRLVIVPTPIGGAWSPTPTRSLVLAGAPGSGVTLSTGDNLFALTLRGRLQIRETVSITPSAATSQVTNDLSIRTVRLILSGHMFSPQTQYFLQLAFAPNDYETGIASPLYDGWVGFTQLRDLQIRAGQFLVPFDRARTNAEWGLNMVDRPGVVQELSLDRDIGIDVGSQDLGGIDRFAYHLGVYAGDGKNRVNPTPGFLYLARVQLNALGAFDDGVEGDLLRLPRPRLAIGLAGGYNQASSRARSTTGNVLTLPGFDFVHAAADITFKWRGLYVLAEGLYRHANADMHTGTAQMAMVTEYSRSGWGYFVQLGVMLTDRFEVSARWEQLLAIGNTDPTLIQSIRSTGNDAGIGLNWYQAGHGLKLQTDYHYSFGTDAEHGRHLVRLALQASF